jgi:homoserine dehydrogenase
MVTVALLGAGRVGRAVAGRLSHAEGRAGRRARIAVALVRDPARGDRGSLAASALTSDPDEVFAARPDVVVELLGGVEPAATLVARALAGGIPVVTANKSLLAAHGADLAAAAAARGVALLYEASVMAGVPFLGALARRREAATISRLQGIVNGTSNYVLTRMADGSSLATALADAQRLGLAEPRPDNDVQGIDAAEKLAVLVHHLGWGRLPAAGIETSGIAPLDPTDLAAAQRFGGSIKPLVLARRGDDGVAAFSGPAFVPAEHQLSGVQGADNALVLTTATGDVTYRGPGAGPDATAATVIDDLFEAVERRAPAPAPTASAIRPLAPATGWFVRLGGARLPAWEDVADLCGAWGVWMRRTEVLRGPLSPGRLGDRAYLLTHPAAPARLHAALDALRHATGLDMLAIRAVEG